MNPNDASFQALYEKFQVTGSIYMPPVITEALLNKKNCSILSRVDKVILSFVNSLDTAFTYSSRNNYERLLAHQLGGWYELATESPHKACVEVILRKPANYKLTRTPVSELIDFVHEYQRNQEKQRAAQLRAEREALMKTLGVGVAPGTSQEELLLQIANTQKLSAQLTMLTAQLSGQAPASPALGFAPLVPPAAPLGLGMGMPMGVPMGLPGAMFPQMAAPQAVRAAPLPMMQDMNVLFGAQQAQLEEALRLQAAQGRLPF